MSIVNFSKFSPGGNDTLFLHEPCPAPEICARAFACLGGEQWGLANQESRTLVMGGGEFCVNAARAFGALLDMHEKKAACTAERVYQINVSGWPGLLTLHVSGSFPQWQIAAQLLLPRCQIEIIDHNHCLVHLPGIKHLLYFAGNMPFPSHAEHIRVSEEKRLKYGLDNTDALGIIHCRQNGAGYGILPYIVIPKAGTAMIEGACGSATLALALALFRGGSPQRLKIAQPASVLDALIAKTTSGLCATIAGPVTFMLSGIFNAACKQSLSGGIKCAE